MKLTLRIENLDYLPDGGPLEFAANDRGFEVGRDPAMDWTLPDPARHISSRHFEVQFRDRQFWLIDLSTNGTFVFGASMRVSSPLLLADKDRLQVGQYIIRVTITDPAPLPLTTPALGTGNRFGLGSAPISPAFGAEAAPAADPWSLQPMPMPDIGRPLTTPPEPSPFPAPEPVAPLRQPDPAPFPAAHQAAAPVAGSDPFPIRPVTAPPVAPAGAADVSGLLAAICNGAGLPPGSLDQVDVGQLGHDIGRSLRIATEQLMALLGARAAAKQFVKSSSRTMIGGMNNSPLKFKPNASEAMLTMFAQRSESYLDATAAFEQGFNDIKRHQTAVYAAMQPALARLLEDLAPESIEERSSGGLISSKKARAWELFVERWDAKTHPYENGMLDVFLAYFADAYDEAVKKTGG